MFSHMMVGSNDIDRSQRFYDALFTATGGKPGRRDDKGRLTYLNKGGAFLVSRPIDDAPAPHATGGTRGFSLARRAPAQAWPYAGVADGGTAIEDAPGVRAGAFGNLYLAYLRDPDGNKLCAMHRMPAE